LRSRGADPLELFSVSSENVYSLVNDLKAMPGAASVFAFGQTAHLAFEPGTMAADNVLQYLDNKGHKQIFVTSIKPNIEDCFMYLMLNK
jgi:ABC-2 type transport system ATP-binding protein